MNVQRMCATSAMTDARGQMQLADALSAFASVVLTEETLESVLTMIVTLAVLKIADASNLHTLPLGVQNFSSQYTTDTAGVLAFTSLAMLPALLFFTLAEKQIVGGLQGAVKG